jgi:peptidoglycan/xylan/chitin deacetylase (PgdA/CDA1 family)
MPVHQRMFILLAAVGLIIFGLLAGARRWVGAYNPEPTMVALVTNTAVAPTSTPTLPPTPTRKIPTYTPIPTSTYTPIPTATPSPSPTASPTNPPPATPEPTATPTPMLWPTPYGGASRTLRVPILMYHYTSTPPEDADRYRINLSIEPEMLRQQFQYLADNGFTPMRLYDLSLAITNQQELPEKPIILTFDDGYLDNYQHAYPLLTEFGYPATFFVITDLVDQNHPAYMNWEMLRELAAAGHDIENHTRTHPDLSTLTRDGMYGQISRARQRIQEEVGQPARYLCYPAGKYNETTLEVVEELGLWGAVTTQSGRWHGFDERYEWGRIRISYTTTLADLAKAIEPEP